MVPGDDLDRLLENAGWVRALGVELVGAGEADDLAQEAWVVALGRPADVRNPAAWLSGVVRRLAGRARRGDERRVQRERAVARPEAQPPADELVAEAELSRALICAVTELDEPFRSTVLLRFYRGWTPEEIARSQAVPAATVRTRLHRALGRLRERLDREHGGREAWALAFASPALGGAAGTAATSTIGGAFMSAKVLWSGAAALALLAATIVLQDRGQPLVDSARERQAVAAADEAPAVPAMPPEPAPATGESARRESVAAAPLGAAYGEVLLYGSVTDPAGRAVELDWLGVEDAGAAARSVSRPVAGSYAIAGLAPGRHVLRARAVGHVSLREELVVRADAEHQRHDVVLAPALAIPVKLVDETGALWEDAPEEVRAGTLDVVVTPTEPSAGLCGLRREPGSMYGCGEYASAEDIPAGYSGLLRLRRPPPLFVSVILRDATLATRRIDGPVSELVFTLDRTVVERQRGGVSARFVDASSGRPVTDGRAALDTPSSYAYRGNTLDELGRARFDDQAPGLYALRFYHADYAATSLSVRVSPGRVEELGDVPVWTKVVIRGTVLDARGAPATASIRWAPLSALRLSSDLETGTHSRAIGGRLELDPVPRGPVRLFVDLRDHAPLVRTIDASSGLVEGLVLQLEEGVRVSLRAPEEWIGRQVTLADESGSPLQTWTVYDGTITTRLAPGRYQLWTGHAERVDAVRELVVEEAPLELDLAEE